MNLTQTGKHLKDVSVSELQNQHLPVGGAVAATTAQTKIDAQVGLLLPPCSHSPPGGSPLQTLNLEFP